jgi:hypothetical protein
LQKCKLSAGKTILLGIFAGIFIGFGAWGFITVLATVQDAGLAKLLGASVFPVGLMLVILCGAELFTVTPFNARFDGQKSDVLRKCSETGVLFTSETLSGLIFLLTRSALRVWSTAERLPKKQRQLLLQKSA